MEFYQFESPLGLLALGEEEGLIVRLYLPNDPTPRLMSRPTPLLERGAAQVLEYLAGTRREFDLPATEEGLSSLQRLTCPPAFDGI